MKTEGMMCFTERYRCLIQMRKRCRTAVHTQKSALWDEMRTAQDVFQTLGVLPTLPEELSRLAASSLDLPSHRHPDFQLLYVK
ncbi:MAG: hypothetical protein DDG58_01940 [Ardenticatenia bacterium]|jgi:hypothetical protein|nr:MAG: hypothetical protein DDG58_01940 [Ardenticatenia bacterium]